MKNFEKLVDAVNLLNKHIPLIVADVKKQLDPSLGKPIFKADGGKRKSVNWEYKPIKKQLENGDWLNVDYSVNESCGHMVELRVRVCLHGGSYAVRPNTGFTIYQEAFITIYEMDKDGNILEFDVDLDSYNHWYSAESLMKQAKEIGFKIAELQTEINQINHRFRDALYIPRIH